MNVDDLKFEKLTLTAAKTLIEKYDATYVFECARMYYGNLPKANIDKIFGITTFELG